MRLCEYPHVVVRVACTKCPRRGSYRVARLAEKHGADITMPFLLAAISGDCPDRTVRHNVTRFCGAHFPDLSTDRPPPLV